MAVPLRFETATSMIKDLGEITRHPVVTVFFSRIWRRCVCSRVYAFDAPFYHFPKLTYQLRLYQSRGGEEDEGKPKVRYVR